MPIKNLSFLMLLCIKGKWVKFADAKLINLTLLECDMSSNDVPDSNERVLKTG